MANGGFQVSPKTRRIQSRQTAKYETKADFDQINAQIAREQKEQEEAGFLGGLLKKGKTLLLGLSGFNPLAYLILEGAGNYGIDWLLDSLGAGGEFDKDTIKGKYGRSQATEYAEEAIETFKDVGDPDLTQAFVDAGISTLAYTAPQFLPKGVPGAPAEKATFMDFIGGGGWVPTYEDAGETIKHFGGSSYLNELLKNIK